MWLGLAMETTSRNVLIAVVVVFVLAPSTPTRTADAQADRMGKVFTEWVDKHSVEGSNLVIVRDGAILGTVGRGRFALPGPKPVGPLAGWAPARGTPVPAGGVVAPKRCWGCWPLGTSASGLAERPPLCEVPARKLSTWATSRSRSNSLVINTRSFFS